MSVSLAGGRILQSGVKVQKVPKRYVMPVVYVGRRGPSVPKTHGRLPMEGGRTALAILEALENQVAGRER